MRRSRRGHFAGCCQLTVNDLLKLGLRLGTVHKRTIDEETRGSGDSCPSAILYILIDPGPELAGCEAGGERLLIQVQAPGSRNEIRFIQSGRVGCKQRVMKLPEFSLFLGAPRGFGRHLRMRMQRSHREVAKCQLDASVVLSKQTDQPRQSSAITSHSRGIEVQR